MLRTLKVILLLAPLIGLACGCASTTVTKNPGAHDRGVRYYLPKPYLLVTTATEKGENDKTVWKAGRVDIVMEMRPDYSEEYSVHIRSGVGINNTTLVLKDGWQLTSVNTEIKSNFSENVDAVSEALGVAKDLKKSGVPRAAEDPMIVGENVAAHNVPLGYYEAVIGPDACGRKQIHGWRYVGFLPFATCPTHIQGVQTKNCTDGELYGLVTENNIMVFKRLDVIKDHKDSCPGKPIP